MKAALILTTLVAGSVGAYSLMDCEGCGDVASACEVPIRWDEPASGAPTAGAPTAAVTSQVFGEPIAAAPVVADFVEARSASVFAGACHVGSEVSSQGRQALMAWAIREGAAADADLAGVRVVAAVSGSQNLAECGERESVVWIDAPRGERQLGAAKAWLSAEHGDALGTVLSVAVQPIHFEREGAGFDVAVGDVVRLRGEAIADGSCCSMQEHRWYEPLGADAGQPVGVPDECHFAGVEGLPAWRYEGQNNVFVGEYVGAKSCGSKASASACSTAQTPDCEWTPEPAACGQVAPSCETKIDA